MGDVASTAEGRRLAEGPLWKRWGPYLADRAWGTVREDYSDDGSVWEAFTHDQARSRAYRWSEDGLCGICDDRQLLCFSWAFWNGQDPFLKERIFGLTGDEGNHGEDAKEYWWHVDATPTHSWQRWRYWYPQTEFPYERLVEENRTRTVEDPEFELIDTGVFDDDRYWDIEVAYAKASIDDVCIRLRVTNRGPVTAEIDVLPTIWFRNTWSWEPTAAPRPTLSVSAGTLIADHPDLGRMILTADDSATPLLCENETSTRGGGIGVTSRCPKDGINDHIVHGMDTARGTGSGTKAALHQRIAVAGGDTRELRFRLSRGGGDLDATSATTMREREHEADEYYAALTPPATPPEQAMVLRQAFAGLLSSKQFYNYDVERWLAGDPPDLPSSPKRHQGRNRDWAHLDNGEIISMPDTWEYPWYASWDLAFHCVALAHVDSAFAKQQLLLMCNERYMHPNGQLPAYEFAFGDANPPVHAWAALRVFETDGSRDYDFLARILHKLLLNFSWWLNCRDANGRNIFQGGALGLDNIGPLDRSGLPADVTLDQSDGTAWVGMYCLNLLELAVVMSEHDRSYEDLAIKFFEDFARIATAMSDLGLWDEADEFYYDVLEDSAGRRPVRVRSMVGLIPLAATTTLGRATLERLPRFAAETKQFHAAKPHLAENILHTHVRSGYEGTLLAIVCPDRVPVILRRMLDPTEFLAPNGLRSLSKFHRDHPVELHTGDCHATIGYEPAESRSSIAGGNSNWRGPIWFPVNYLLVESLERFARFFGDDLLIEHPTGGGVTLTLSDIADDLRTRLIGLFLDDRDERRPAHGGIEKFDADPHWHDMIAFHEYFHGDTGAGLGASHQTGWTGLVANLIMANNRSPRHPA